MSFITHPLETTGVSPRLYNTVGSRHASKTLQFEMSGKKKRTKSLTDKKVKAMLRYVRIAEGKLSFNTIDSNIAKHFNISKSNSNHIRNRRTWKHVEI